ncbi:MAG: hypothetical protein IKI84_02605 [Clostridia bacterium]|nr:hypothetical protein [Clostridia bacterium]
MSEKNVLRKLLVSLKRKPALVAMCVLLVAFIVYTFSLTNVSHTTSRINKPNMGLAEFASMLLSVLSMVCFMNAYPRRKKPNYIMLGLSLAMLLIIFLCDGMYIGKIGEALNDPKSQLDTAKETYILATRAMLNVHRIILVIGAALAVLVPWYGKLLRKINTNVNIEGNSDMAAIEIEGND